MSGNGSRERTRYYGTVGSKLPTPRACDGLRAGGGNQTELMMSAERLENSGLWPTPHASCGTGAGDGGRAGGLNLQTAVDRMWPTPRAGKVTDEDEEAWMARHKKGDVSTPPLSLAVKLWATPSANEPGINPDRIVDKHGNPPDHVHQRLYDRETGRMVQDGLSQQVAIVANARMWMTPKAGDADFGLPRTKGRSPEMSTHLATQVQYSPPDLTSSPQATPANPSPSPASAEATMMTVISGRKLLGSLGGSLPPSDPAGCFLRTLLATSAWGSTRCYLTWNRSATPQSRPLYRLQVSTRLTAGIASGLRAATLEMERQQAQLSIPIPSTSCSESVGQRPTPNAAKAGNDLTLRTAGGRAAHWKPNKLKTEDEERMWWTPSVAVGMTDFVLTPAMADRYHTIHEGNLNEQVAATLFPAVGDSSSHDASAAVGVGNTPTARDHKGVGDPNAAGIIRNMERGLLAETIQHQEQQPNRRLHSRWVARLMGMPDGWLDPSPAPALDPRWNGHPLNAFGPDWEDGMPRVVAAEDERVNKLKACGNGIVPQVAWVLLSCMDEAGW